MPGPQRCGVAWGSLCSEAQAPCERRVGSHTSSPKSNSMNPIVSTCAAALLATTLVSAVVFAACYVLYVNRLVTLDDLATLFGLLR